MNKIIYKIQRFLTNRYGPDELYKFLIIICLIITFVNIFLNSKILRILELLLFVMTIYRVLSKNKNKRRRENKIYLNILNKINKAFDYQKKKYKDRNTHLYKKCRKCKQKIRLPLKKGKHSVKCPSCGHKFSVRCYKNEKVEIIK